MRKLLYGVLLCLLLLMVSGCGKKEKDLAATAAPTLAPTEVAEVPGEPTVAPVVETHEGQALSKLSATWVSEKVANRRPFAVMINNLDYAARRHSGISQASIMYEAIVEGSITRCMAIFEDFDAKKIGSVRSARHYFVSIADEYDAIFVHYGQTKYALAKMKTLGTDNLSGLEGVGSTVFYRDNAIHAPHNAFASYKGIIAGTKQKKYRTKYEDDTVGHYLFYPADTDIVGEKEASKVTLKFSSYASPYFEYNSTDKLYYRFQFKAAHKDVATDTQLAFKNLIIQYVKEWDIDRNGYQTMDLENANGKGMYITNGQAVPITWKKNESKSTMKYYDQTGAELTINPGKTYVALFPNDRTKDVVIKGTK